MENQMQHAQLPQAMAFYHEKGLVAAWKQASKFAGEGGRVAAMPDLIEAKLAATLGSVAWEKYFTTASAEYVGLSRGGKKIIIAAHGVGPMATLDGILKAYSFEFADKDRNHRGGRISREDFLALESGSFGPVSVVDFASVCSRYKYPFLAVLTESEAHREPLLSARFGKNAHDYISHHAKIARQWHEAMSSENSMHREFAKQGSDPFIIQLSDANNCPYLYHEPEDGMAIAHLLSAGTAVNSHHDRSRGVGSLVVEYACHEWSDGVRLAGLRAGAKAADIHPGVGAVSQLIRAFWPELMRPASPTHVGMRRLTDVGGECFTEYPKVGESLDTGEPEYCVSKLEPVGEPVEFQTPIGGYHGFVKYGLNEVEAIAPPQANAYRVVSDWEIVGSHGDPTHHRALLQFYDAQVDTSQRVAREKDLINDYDILMSLVLKQAA